MPMKRDWTRNAVRIAIIVVTFGVTLVPGIAGAQTTGNQFSLQVDGLACPFCTYGIEKRLNAIDGIEHIKIDIALGRVTVTMRAGKTLDEATAGKAVAAAGFTMRSFSTKAAGK